MNGSSCCSPSRGPNDSPVVNQPLQRTSAGSLRDMRLIPGGEFLMGSNDADARPDDGEMPVHPVTIESFHLDACAVTNEQFNEFVETTSYKTEAEKFGWSAVFHLLLDREQRLRVTQWIVGAEWWCRVDGATWRHPEGPGSTIKKRWNHPVVHVSWNDAMAYCAWAGKRLPTDAEWECASRGGLVQKRFAWGDELTPGGKHMCNIWQGSFPTHNTLEDGFLGTAPAKSFKTNGYGLYNVAGNVWEWCHDWFSRDFLLTGTQIDPTGPPQGERKIVRGGSYLCHDSYCNRYRVAARTTNTPDSSTGNTGFRCARDL